MPITFSSFGDVATVLQLAWQLRAALSDASGASAEIRALIIDVDSFTRALQQTKAAVEKRRTPIAPAIENGIKHAIIACYDALRLILRKIDAFKTRITSRIGVAAWRQYWAVAAWSILGGKKDVDSLRVRLSEQIGVVQTYLALAQSNDQAKVQETVESQGVALDRIYGVMQDIQMRFDVGVPSFHFYEEHFGYYTPFARTSFQRIKELSELIHCWGFPLVEEANNLLTDTRWSHSTLPVREPLTLSITLNFKSRSRRTLATVPEGYVIQLCIFKERAFDQWQVLLGSRFAGKYLELEVLKILIERPHPVGSRCLCKVGTCRNQLERLERQVDRERPFVYAMALVDQIEHLAMWLTVADREAQLTACADLDRAIYALDRAFLKRSIIPLLRLHVECQLPSLQKIQHVCKSGTLMASSFPYFGEIHLGIQTTLLRSPMAIADVSPMSQRGVSVAHLPHGTVLRLAVRGKHPVCANIYPGNTDNRPTSSRLERRGFDFM